MKKKYIREIILKNKKLMAIISVILILGSGFMFLKYRKAKNIKIANSQGVQDTVILKKGEINKSIIVNGNVKSGEVSNVSSPITAKVKSIDVSVGDIVKVGDIICTLDSSDIDKEIEKKTKAIEEERITLQENYNKLLSQLDLLKNKQIQNLNSHNTTINKVAKKLNTANDELSRYEATFSSVKNTYNIMLTGINDKQKSYDNALNNKNKYYEAWIKSGGRTDSQEYKKYIEASENLDRKQKELDEAKELYDYDNISNKYNEALTIYNEKIAARDTVKAEHEEAVSNSISSANADKAEIDSLQNNINDVYKQIQKLNDNEELNELKENLNKTVLKAETNGKITELKVNVGSMAEGVIATIQSTDNLILEVNIPEYDIKKVSAGMKTKITSSALEHSVNGELVSISPIASGDDKVGFSATISIEKESGLFIGTNAKAEIIISSKSDVILAPIDAVKDINGNPSILLKEDNGEFKEVQVIIGEKNDYYVEISGEQIKEGMEIKNNIDLDEFNSNLY